MPIFLRSFPPRSASHVPAARAVVAIRLAPPVNGDIAAPTVSSAATAPTASISGAIAATSAAAVSAAPATSLAADLPKLNIFLPQPRAFFPSQPAPLAKPAPTIPRPIAPAP